MNGAMLATMKAKVKGSLRSSSLVYRSLAVAYRFPTRVRTVGWIAALSEILRPAQMYFRKDSRFVAGELWMAASRQPKVLRLLVEKFKPRSLLDVGCGVGQMLKSAQALGLEVAGLEGSTDAIAASGISGLITLTNLNEPQNLGRKFDLVWSVEVAEHIHPKYTSVFLDTISRHGDLALLSAAPPGQGGAGHFNEQPPAYWHALMRTRGYELDATLTREIQASGDPFSENMMLFSRRASVSGSA